MLLSHIRSDEFTSFALLLSGLGELQEMTIGIAEEGSDLIAPVHRLSEELGSARAQHPRRAAEQSGTRMANSLLTLSASVGGAKVTAGLSCVGPPGTVSRI
jgi:hypothetical protein